jgi:hypothetical protein
VERHYRSCSTGLYPKFWLPLVFCCFVLLKRCIYLQDPILFTGTVASNIAYANPSATRIEIEEVAREANCDFVWKLPAGFDTESMCLVLFVYFRKKKKKKKKGVGVPAEIPYHRCDWLTFVGSWQVES